jgi:hypothetical protein
MHKMSKEQESILEYIITGVNVIVDACAGSGKSTTILSIAKELPDMKIRQFTYNSMLRHEIKEKTRELGLANIEIHTYHSFSVKYYSSDAHTDTGIRNIIGKDTKPRQLLPEIDLLVIDESQDMTFLYFQLIVKMIRDSGKRVQLLILGDYMQGLYEFKGADIRFLTHADFFWKELPLLKNNVFQKCTLKMSYRITNQMAKFINRDMLGENRLNSCRDGTPVIYIRRPRHQIEQIVVYQIRRLLSEGESPSDFFVLGSSVKGVNSNIRRMENTLTEHGIPCHVPMFETDASDERVIDGKVVFSTFHSVKGRQRKYVFIVGFDQGYFYNARNMDLTICPNTLYVGTTRATHGLYLLENDSSRPLSFLKQNHHEMKQSDYIDFKGMPQTIFHTWEKEELKNEIQTYFVTVTDLIKFVSEDVLEEISPIIDRIFITETPIDKDSEIDIPKIVEVRDGLFEDVSDLNGIAIPSMYYDEIQGDKRGATVLKDMIQQALKEVKPGRHSFLKRAVESISDICETSADYLYLANVYVAVQEKLYYKLKQIERHNYTWLSHDMVDRCISVIKKSIDHSLEKEIERQIIHHSQDLEHINIDSALFPYFENESKFRFSARVDLLTESTLWELKCTSQLTMDHKMQLVIYAWLWRVLFESDNAVQRKHFKMLNIRTGEMLRLESGMDDLTKIVTSLLRNKYEKPIKLTDTEFIQKCGEYIVADTIFSGI